MTAPEVSVVMPTRNRQALLPGVLASLAAQTYPSERWQLVVVDDGSTDGTPALLDAFSRSVRFEVRVLHGPKCGAGAARNRGAERADGRLLLFLDDDMLASPQLIAEHASSHLAPRDTVIGRIAATSGPRDPWMAWEDAQLARRSTALAGRSDGPGPRDVYSGNCSLDADLFRSVGGFDTSLERGEDFALGYRLAAAGSRFLYRAAAAAMHLGSHDFASWAENAAAFGRSEAGLRGTAGAEALSVEAAQWYRQRHLLNRTLVRLCAGRPALRRPLIAGIDRVGRLAHRVGARRAAGLAYSAIYNLAYWQGLIEALGADRFWRNVGDNALLAPNPDSVALNRTPSRGA